MTTAETLRALSDTARREVEQRADELAAHSTLTETEQDEALARYIEDVAGREAKQRR